MELLKGIRIIKSLFSPKSALYPVLPYWHWDHTVFLAAGSILGSPSRGHCREIGNMQEVGLLLVFLLFLSEACLSKELLRK